MMDEGQQIGRLSTMIGRGQEREKNDELRIEIERLRGVLLALDGGISIAIGHLADADNADRMAAIRNLMQCRHILMQEQL